MTYTVIWTLSAVTELGRITSAAADPGAVRAAANRIDFTLRRTPHDMGESRDPGERLWYDDDLVVRYRVDDNRTRVDVLAVGPARRG